MGHGFHADLRGWKLGKGSAPHPENQGTTTRGRDHWKQQCPSSPASGQHSLLSKGPQKAKRAAESNRVVREGNQGGGTGCIPSESLDFKVDGGGCSELMAFFGVGYEIS